MSEASDAWKQASGELPSWQSGRSRDTAWYACVAAEWPALEAAFETWLDDANFDANGNQRRRLSDLTRPVLVAFDPALDPETPAR